MLLGGPVEGVPEVSGLISGGVSLIEDEGVPRGGDESGNKAGIFVILPGESGIDAALIQLVSLVVPKGMGGALGDDDGGVEVVSHDVAGGAGKEHPLLPVGIPLDERGEVGALVDSFDSKGVERSVLCNLLGPVGEDGLGNQDEGGGMGTVAEEIDEPLDADDGFADAHLSGNEGGLVGGKGKCQMLDGLEGELSLPGDIS